MAEAGVSIFALPTSDTDYLLVWEQQMARAIGALFDAGRSVQGWTAA